MSSQKSNQGTKKILIIGNYDESYPRNKVLIGAFKNKFYVKEACFFDDKKKQWLFLKTLLKARNKYDYIFVMREGQAFAFLLLIYKIFFHSKIIFDAFYSLYDAYVFDRKLVKEKSLKAKYYYFIDWLSCRVADILIFDTHEHKDYFYKTFNVKFSKKFLIIPISVNLEQIDKIKVGSKTESYFLFDKMTFLFFGYYIPLQGIEYIIKAAHKLKNNNKIRFLLIGAGQTKSMIDKLVKELKPGNVDFVNNRIAFEEVVEFVKRAEVCLGIFGNTDKAKRVVPNKTIESLACGKITITGRSGASERYFVDNEDVAYCNMADAEDLAKKIEFVYNNYVGLKYMETNGRRKIEKYFSQKAINKIIDKNLL